MSFSQSSQNIRLEGSTLHADCRASDGNFHSSSLNLDSCLGNENGSFQWGKQNFSHSAQGFGLNVPILTASLQNEGGGFQQAEINLDERIANDNGNLKFVS
ncbi:hypothetical protein FRC08_003363 [Ceratobasidium sp. 394]|nr:hypothetical protein FRC08_003363 [Ceratobasidium sp. 394]KAG9098448.1 hypothetical protein FS749_003779 [Ceratobasidium sp. UAMH 11750]